MKFTLAAILSLAFAAPSFNHPRFGIRRRLGQYCDADLYTHANVLGNGILRCAKGLECDKNHFWWASFKCVPAGSTIAMQAERDSARSRRFQQLFAPDNQINGDGSITQSGVNDLNQAKWNPQDQ